MSLLPKIQNSSNYERKVRSHDIFYKYKKYELND